MHTKSALSLRDRAERRGVSDLVQGACMLVGVTESDWYGASRAQPIPEARAIAWIAMRRRGLPYAEIARISGKDHTTIMTACGARAGRVPT